MYNKPDVVTRIHGDQINDGYNDPVVILYNDPSPIGEGINRNCSSLGSILKNNRSHFSFSDPHIYLNRI